MEDKVAEEAGKHLANGLIKGAEAKAAELAKKL